MDSAVAITAGAGTNIDTRTEGTSGHHRQVVVIGDPATNAGVASVDATYGVSFNIVGLSGNAISLGAGAVAAGTPRYTLASDDPAVTALEIIDDWDEADRCAVNLISGQVGVSGGSGVVGAATVRVTLATDVSLPAPGTTATSLGKAEDAAHTSGDTGIAALAVRRDAKAVGAGTDGDYATINTTANGDVRVDGGQAYVITVAPTVTAGPYTADDIIGGEMTLTDAARASGEGGIISAVTFIAEDDAADGWAANGIEVMIFDSNPAGTYTDNAVLDSSSLTDADAALLLGTVLLNTKVDLGNVTMLKATNVNIPYLCSGSADLYAVAINRGGVTPEATDAITFKFHLIRG